MALRLHLGCGTVYLDGYARMDALPYAFHRSGFSPAGLERLLRAAGFREVRHLPNTLHFYPACIVVRDTPRARAGA